VQLFQLCTVIPANGDFNCTPPDLTVFNHESGEEVVVLARGASIFHRDNHCLISRAPIAFPGTMLGGKSITAVFRRELQFVSKRVVIPSIQGLGWH
jgi:hypothetical protein